VVPGCFDHLVSLRIIIFQLFAIEWIVVVLAPVCFSHLREKLITRIQSIVAQLLPIKGQVRHRLIPAISFGCLVSFANHRLDTFSVMVVEGVSELVQNDKRLRTMPVQIVCHLINFNTLCLLGVITSSGQPLLTNVVTQTAPLYNLAAIKIVDRIVNIDMFGHDDLECCLWYFFSDNLKV